jgi:hypothetical protein
VALPVILVNSATGSDSLASGAGPATAITGTLAVPTGTSVAIADAVALGGVATDGSAVLYLADATAGHRNFDSITAISGSSGAWVVTVANGFSTSASNFNWAIGGVRASIGSATSKKLLNNNGSAGDAMPGWTVQMQSGHSETITAEIDTMRTGDQTNGLITLQGDPAAATRPVLTFSNNGTAFNAWTSYKLFANFEMQNSNATKTASVAFTGGPDFVTIRNVKIANASNNFWQAINNTAGGWAIYDCEIGYCSNIGINVNGHITVGNCYIHDCTSDGLQVPLGTTVCPIFIGNIFGNNGGCGLNFISFPSTYREPTIYSNTFHNNTGDGLKMQGTGTAMQFALANITNNIFSNNGSYGLNFSGAGMSNLILASLGTVIRNNCFYTNTSGPTNPSSLAINVNSSSLNPQYVNSAGGNYAIGTNLKAQGYPLGGTLAIGTTSSTYSYVDIGAAQRQEAGGSSGGFIVGSGV